MAVADWRGVEEGNDAIIAKYLMCLSSPCSNLAKEAMITRWFRG